MQMFVQCSLCNRLISMTSIYWMLTCYNKWWFIWSICITVTLVKCNVNRNGRSISMTISNMLLCLLQFDNFIINRITLWCIRRTQSQNSPECCECMRGQSLNVFRDKERERERAVKNRWSERKTDEERDRDVEHKMCVTRKTSFRLVAASNTLFFLVVFISFSLSLSDRTESIVSDVLCLCFFFFSIQFHEM